MILVTGGAGFIGSALIRYIIKNTSHAVVNVDKLTYAGNLRSLDEVKMSDRYFFELEDICDSAAMNRILFQYQPDIVFHLAAESHVDRSISSPNDFIETNIRGTYILLEAVLRYWLSLSEERKTIFRFHHVSTDEVYGDRFDICTPCTENSAYMPSSPYAASKAAGDHLVRAWYRTYGLPILISNCSNNYGPYQFPEKFIPRIILNALQGESLPIYGDGAQIRDWLYVDDHVRALLIVATKGRIGETYNIGAHNEQKNLIVVEMICELLEGLALHLKSPQIKNYRDLITFVEDRPGHDRRYAINASKIQNELGWLPLESFAFGLKKTVQWYLDNQL